MKKVFTAPSRSQRPLCGAGFPRILAAFILLTFVGVIPKVRAEPAAERSLFVSVIQHPQTLSSKPAIQELIAFAVKARVRVLFVQIYRADQAWFPSELSDDQPFREILRSTGEDTFAYLIREAHAAGLEVHAWLNLLSLSTNHEASILKKYGPSVLTRKPGPEKKKIEDYLIDNQYFLEPSDSRVRDYLLGLVEEVIRAYPELDGIQADYIRYPDSQPFYGYTEENLERFKTFSGIQEVNESSPGWKDWRRGQVTELVEMLSKKAKELQPGIVFSTTGCAPYSRAYHEAFQDWALWIEKGYADYVTMMSYPLDPLDLEENMMGARARAESLDKVNIGIGAYKMLGQPELFAQHWTLCEASDARGCTVFHYGNLLENPELGKQLVEK